MKKAIISILSLTFIFNFGFTQTTSILANEVESKTTIESRADVIEWRYKIKDGKLYKRKYNYTKKQWIGNWVLA